MKMKEILPVLLKVSVLKLFHEIELIFVYFWHVILLQFAIKDSAGKSEKSTNLRVYQRPEIKSFRNESYDQYQRSYLECRVIGIPIPMITIRKNGLTRPFIHGDPGIVLEERMDKHEKVLTLTYLNTVNK